MPKLENEDHERFCNEFIKDLNASKAYQRAYPEAKPTTARNGGSQLIAKQHISERIAELKEKREKRTQTSQDKVVQQLANIAFADLGFYCTWNETEGLKLVDSDDLEADKRAGIQAIETSPIHDKDGNFLGFKKKVTLSDRTAALKLLGLHLGMFDGSGANKSNKDAIKERFLDAFERVADRLGTRGDKRGKS